MRGSDLLSEAGGAVGLRFGPAKRAGPTRKPGRPCWPGRQAKPGRPGWAGPGWADRNVNLLPDIGGT